MRKAPEPTKVQGAFQNHQQQGDSIKPAYFLGTDNPRHLRAIHALWVSPQPREAIDNRAGCSNGPELIAELRRRGLEIPCERTQVIDRDGVTVRIGIYSLSSQDRAMIHAAQREGRDRGKRA